MNLIINENILAVLNSFDSETAIKALNILANYSMHGIEPEGLSGELFVLFTLAKPMLDDCDSYTDGRSLTSRDNGKKGGRPKKPNENLKKPKKPNSDLGYLGYLGFENDTADNNNNNNNINNINNINNNNINNNINNKEIREIDKGGYRGEKEEREETFFAQPTATNNTTSTATAGDTPAQAPKNKRGSVVKISKRFIKPTLEEVQEYCDSRNNFVSAQAFIDFYESKGWVIGKSPMKDWKAAVRTWEQRSHEGRASPSNSKPNWQDTHPHFQGEEKLFSKVKIADL